ncbi:MAG: SIS domain-containing protein, partial [Blautia wexlerae]
MLKFNEQKQIESVNGALALRNQINELIDGICKEGYKNICWLGIGGTYASCLQAEVHMKEKSELSFFVENAAEYLTTGNKKVGEGTIVIISSVTGTTSEIVDGVKKAQKSGARVIGFIDVATAELAKLVDYVITYPANEQLKFYMVADRFMYNAGEFPEYEDLYKELDQYLATALVEVEKEADAFGEEFANRHKDDKIHYFVGAGNQYGATYSYAMCYWEEQHWIRTKSIHSAEFFHGMLEIIDKDTPVTVFIGEDSQRSLSERVANFLPRICGKYNIIDTKKFELKGISPE